MDEIPEIIKGIATATGGKVDECRRLLDGSGFATMSMPLPKDHWLTTDGYNEPPAPMRIGTDDPARNKVADDIRSAARYAIRAATENGKVIDFDPDAMVQCFVVGLLGYWTPDGKTRL